VQDFETKEVLMLAYINDLAWQKTLETGKDNYWSR
jgi:phosphoribosyl-AMP cyclohydrolase